MNCCDIFLLMIPLTRGAQKNINLEETKMTKRILALLLAVLLGVSCFALTACGGDEKEPTPPETNKTPETPEPPETSETPKDPTPNGPTQPTLQLFSDTANLIIGEDVWDFNDNAFVLNHKTLTFTSADEAVATVDENGVVTPVGEGTTTINIVAANGELTEAATLTVTVKKPFEPETEIDKEIFGIMRDSSVNKLKTYEPFTVHIVGTAFCPPDMETDTAGPCEVWTGEGQTTLQLLFKLNVDEIDATIGLKEAGYNYYFDFYYKPYDEATEKEGGYKKATIQAWSCYKYGEGQPIIYRCLFYEALGQYLEIGKYTVQIVVREGDLVKGWCTADGFEWTDAAEAFVQYALDNPDTVVK